MYHYSHCKMKYHCSDVNVMYFVKEIPRHHNSHKFQMEAASVGRSDYNSALFLLFLMLYKVPNLYGI